MAKCTVSYRDRGGVEHTVKVSARSLYEAAALGLDALTAGDLKADRLNISSILEVTIDPPTVMHRVRVEQLQSWISGPSKGPKERLLKERLRGWMGK